LIDSTILYDDLGILEVHGKSVIVLEVFVLLLLLLPGHAYWSSV